MQEYSDKLLLFVAVKKDSWIGVQNYAEERFYDGESSPPLQLLSYPRKTFANGNSYEDGFDYDFGLHRSWDGPCLFLKAQDSFETHEAENCDSLKGFLCEWNGKHKYKANKNYFKACNSRN